MRSVQTLHEAKRMQLDQYFVRLTSLALFNKVENLIDQSLHSDWVIRIQYGAETSTGEAQWHQWKSPFFALKDARSLNEEILACRMCFPHSPVRLYAEKVRPETRLIYTLYTPNPQPLVQEKPDTGFVKPIPIPDYQQARL